METAGHQPNLQQMLRDKVYIHGRPNPGSFSIILTANEIKLTPDRLPPYPLHKYHPPSGGCVSYHGGKTGGGKQNS